MDNLLDVYNKSNKTCLKYRRSHSISFPVDVDRVFWNRIRANIKMENIIPNTIQIEKCSSISPESVTLYYPQKKHSVRRSLDFKEREHKIMTPILYKFEHYCNHEDDKSLKIKLNTLKALQESDERRLISLTSENKNIKKKLEKLNFEILKKENELGNLYKTNELVEVQIIYFLNKHKKMKILYKENTKKVNNIIDIAEIIRKIEICESDIYKLYKDIKQLKNDYDTAKKQYERFRCDLYDVYDIILVQTKCLNEYCEIGKDYLNYLKKELYGINNEQNKYALENENLKLKYNELKTKLNLMNNKSHNEKKMYTVLLNIFLYFIFY